MTAQPVEMLRKDDGDWVKKSMSYEVEGVIGRPRTTWNHVVKRGTRENVVWKGRMHRSMRSGGNCCGKPAANPVYKAGKTVVKWLLLVTGKGEIKIRREREREARRKRKKTQGEKNKIKNFTSNTHLESCTALMSSIILCVLADFWAFAHWNWDVFAARRLFCYNSKKKTIL